MIIPSRCKYWICMVLSFLQCRCIRPESVCACVSPAAARTYTCHVWRRGDTVYCSLQWVRTTYCINSPSNEIWFAKTNFLLQRRKYYPRSDSKSRIPRLADSIIDIDTPMLSMANNEYRCYKFGFMIFGFIWYWRRFNILSVLIIN